MIAPNRKVIAARRAQCAAEDTVEHVTLVRLGDETLLAAPDLVALIDAGREYFMDAPSGMRLVDGNGVVIDGELPPLILQARDCPHCHTRVPFA